jgi:uncharacterized protein (TIGR02452 family)
MEARLDRERSDANPRRGPRSDPGPWNAEDFKARFAEAAATGDLRKKKEVMKEVSENNYALRKNWSIPRTVMYPFADVMRRLPPGGTRDVQISFSNMTTGDAVKYFASQRGHQVCALNFANGSSVGGGYKNGAIAQEEDLCRRCPTLYTSLNNAHRDHCYPFGPATCRSRDRPERYSHVLFTPGVVLARGGQEAGFALWPDAEQVPFSLITAAAPNVGTAREVYDLDLMYNTVQSIFVAPKLAAPDTTTLILGAWGCGVFGCNPRDMSALFAKAIKERRLGNLYTEIHFAIPSFSATDTNSAMFMDTLQHERIAVRTIQPSG